MTTNYDKRMHSVMNNPAGRSLYATVGRRRAVVAAHVVLTVLGVGAMVAMSLRDEVWVVVLLFAVLVPWCVATSLINGATRGLLELREQVLDERQLADRDRVHAVAQRVTTYLLLGLALAVAGMGWFGDVWVGARLSPVLIGVLALHWLMPLWVAGLLAKDEPVPE